MRQSIIIAGMVTLMAIGAGALWLVGQRNARAMPVVRTATIALDRWPGGAAPVRAVLMADIHLGNSAMDRERLDRIVARVNRLAPDLVLIAGDFVEGADPARAAERGAVLAASLGRLRPRLGTVAVLGNHDYWTDAARIAAALRGAGITVLVNRSILRGPLAIGGVDDDFSRHADTAAVLRQLDGLPGGRLILTHSPDVSAHAGEVALVLAGHTHCAQVYIPGLHLPSVSRYGWRYRCGIIREGRRVTIVTAGLGASSQLPIRFNAPPDIWLLTFTGTEAS